LFAIKTLAYVSRAPRSARASTPTRSIASLGAELHAYASIDTAPASNASQFAFERSPSTVPSSTYEARTKSERGSPRVVVVDFVSSPRENQKNKQIEIFAPVTSLATSRALPERPRTRVKSTRRSIHHPHRRRRQSRVVVVVAHTIDPSRSEKPKRQSNTHRRSSTHRHRARDRSRSTTARAHFLFTHLSRFHPARAVARVALSRHLSSHPSTRQSTRQREGKCARGGVLTCAAFGDVTRRVWIDRRA
jgi:hypothetical protein